MKGWKEGIRNEEKNPVKYLLMYLKECVFNKMVSTDLQDKEWTHCRLDRVLQFVLFLRIFEHSLGLLNSSLVNNGILVLCSHLPHSINVQHPHLKGS